jgi:FkbH-like protein
LQIHLADKFGDNGMVSIVICKTSGNCWEIDTWLMSCRVIKRRVEEAVCDELAALARTHGIRILRGFYRPTEKNKLVKTHYQQLGFNLVSSDEVQEMWELVLDTYQPKNPPIKIEQSTIPNLSL